MASRASRPALELVQLVQEAVVLDVCRKATTSGCGRIASATSSSASPISDVTLWGTDCVSVSATFFSPSHACSCSLSHHVASIADMNTWWLCGSNRIRFSSWMSARMKSSRADPDFVRMSRFNAATEAWLRPISSVTMAGSVSIGAGAPPGGGPPGPSSGSDGMKSPRSTMVCSASPMSGSDLPRASRRPARLAGEARRSGDVDEQPPAGLGHRPRASSSARRRAPAVSWRRSSSADDRRRRRRGCLGRRPLGWGTAS